MLHAGSGTDDAVADQLRARIASSCLTRLLGRAALCAGCIAAAEGLWLLLDAVQCHQEDPCAHDSRVQPDPLGWLQGRLAARMHQQRVSGIRLSPEHGFVLCRLHWSSRRGFLAHVCPPVARQAAACPIQVWSKPGLCARLQHLRQVRQIQRIQRLQRAAKAPASEWRLGVMKLLRVHNEG